MKPIEFAIHCIVCGKDFRIGDKPECGGRLNGKPMCETGDIQREMDKRLQEGVTK